MASKTFACCYIHIGLAKTGTSSIQAFLLENAVQLRRHGYFIPDSLRHNGSRNMLYLTAYAQDDGKVESPQKAAFLNRYQVRFDQLRDRLVRALHAEINDLDVPVRDMVLSTEHLHTHLDTVDEIQRVYDLCQPYAEQQKIIVYLRRQDRMAVSSQSTEALIGGQKRPVLPDVVDGHVPYFYDYKAILQNYETVFGEENIIVRVLEPARLVGQDLLKDFCDVIGLEDQAGLQWPTRENESISYKAQQFLFELNRHVPADDPLRGQEMLRDVMLEKYRGKGEVLTRAQAKGYYQHFQDTNRWIASRYLGQDEPLFSEDFSDYPDAVEIEPPRFEDAVEIAAELWKESQRALHVPLSKRFVNALNRKLKRAIMRIRDRFS